MSGIRSREQPALKRGTPFLAELGRRLRSARVTRGLSQEALARAAGISTRYLSQLESGRGNISVVRLYELARALGTPLHELVRLEQGQPFVSLIGLRGAGKSTVGPLVAKALRYPFVELDAMIEEEAGLRLGELFALHGESYYRKLERETLERVLASGPASVVATGGSLVTETGTYALLKENTVTVWLQATPELHLNRVAAQGDRRPMAGHADPLSELRVLLRGRDRLYREAQIVVDTSRLSPEATADAIVARLADLRTRGLGVESQG